MTTDDDTNKVNAVKNEEASQVSRLEEEIRALKQKLASQMQTASTSSISSPSAASLLANGDRHLEEDGRGRGAGAAHTEGDRCVFSP